MTQPTNLDAQYALAQKLSNMQSGALAACIVQIILILVGSVGYLFSHHSGSYEYFDVALFVALFFAASTLVTSLVLGRMASVYNRNARSSRAR